MNQSVNMRTIRAFLALSFVVACIASAPVLSSCSTEENEPVVLPPYYNQAGFSRDGQFYRYVEDGVLAHKTGVDVSDHQGWIDWETVAATDIRFAYIRAGYRGSTEGELYQDDYFAFNMEAAKQAGLERGVYFFSQAVNEDEAREEAAFLLQLLNGKDLDYPVAFDFEMAAEGIQSRVANISAEEASAIARAFCETVQAAGYDCCLYGNGHDLGRYDEALLNTWPVWYAEYGALPSYPNQYVLWQYASAGVVEGIGTEVDLNLDLSTIVEQS